jgi:hypothetical protein
MQNKPKVKSAQIDLSNVIARIFARMDIWSNGKNKPKQSQFNPNQTQNKTSTRNGHNSISIGELRRYNRCQADQIKPKTEPN